MLAWLVWLHALPTSARRLIGAVLILGTSVGLIALTVHRYGNRREAEGYNAGWNHAVVIETQKQVVVVDSLEAVADSASAHARKADDRLSLVRDSTDTKLRHAVRIGRIVPLAADSLVPTVPLSNMVRIYVANDDTPHYADAYIGKLVVWYDSVVYRQLLPQRDSAVVLAVAWKRAWGSEHVAREASDSLSALWRTRALNMPPSAKASRTRDVAFATLGIVAGFVAARHIR